MRAYAIGDIHGQLEKLRTVHRWIEADKARVGDAGGDAEDDGGAPVVHLGDFADRGPDVRGVLAHLRAGQARGAPWVFIKGNHDRMMWHFLQQPEARDPLRHDLHWLQDSLGGRATLASYGVDVAPARPIADIHRDARAAVPGADMDFLAGLPLHFSHGGAFFCHAGIRPGVPLDRQREDDLVWIRREFLDDPRDHGALIVHGHTPVKQVTDYGNRLNVDTGAAYGGPLSAVVIEDGAIHRITADGRAPVHRA